MIRRSRRIELAWPELIRTGYERDSSPTINYNCIAYAAGDLWAWWDHYNYWPPGAQRGAKLLHLISAFQVIGFQDCGKDKILEAGFEKVALYESADGNWSHAARLRVDGWWESKLGDWDDILHKEPEALEGRSYGTIGRCMKRTIAEGLRARIESRRRARANNMW
jgi:hypothetical protein